MAILSSIALLICLRKCQYLLEIEIIWNVQSLSRKQNMPMIGIAYYFFLVYSNEFKLHSTYSKRRNTEPMIDNLLSLSSLYKLYSSWCKSMMQLNSQIIISDFFFFIANFDLMWQILIENEFVHRNLAKVVAISLHRTFFCTSWSIDYSKNSCGRCKFE